jgi:hypothetical protein
VRSIIREKLGSGDVPTDVEDEVEPDPKKAAVAKAKQNKSKRVLRIISDDEDEQDTRSN